MQLQHLRRRLQALIGTKKSLPDVIEILELLYAELNASATFLTRRDMANFLYICREALSWGPAAILKVSLVLDLLVSTDTYLLGQILTQNPHVSGVFRKPLGAGVTSDAIYSIGRPCRKYSIQISRNLKHDRFSRVDSTVQPASQNQLGRIFQNIDCVKAMCRLYRHFFNQISVAASMPTEESVAFFTDVALCFVDFLKPIIFILLRNTNHLNWFTSFLTPILLYLVETDLSVLHHAGIHFFILLSEVMFCILSPAQPFSERYINVNFEHSHLLSSRTTLSRELISIINDLPIFKELLIPSHFTAASDMSVDTEHSTSSKATAAFHLTVTNPSNITNLDILHLIKFYSLQKDIPIITSITSKYSLHHALFIYSWCSKLLIAIKKGKDFASVTELLLLLRLLEYYAEIPVLIISYLSEITTPEFFKLMSMDLMQELSLPLTACFVSLNTFLTQFISQKQATSACTELLAYMRNKTTLLILNFSVQMTAWSGSNCYHVLCAFHKLVPTAELIMRSSLRALDGELVKLESEALVAYSSTLLQNYVSGLVLFLRGADPGEIRKFFSDVHLGKLLDELLWPVHLFDQALLPAIAGSLMTLILELIMAIPRMYKDLILITEMPSSVAQADTLFWQYAGLIDVFFHDLFLSPISFFRVTLRYAEACSSKRLDTLELIRVISSIKVIQHIFTESFIKDLFLVLLTETCYLNKAYSLLRIYKLYSYCEKERDQLGSISSHTAATILLQNIMKEDEHGLGYYMLELVIRPMTLIIRFTALESFLTVLTQALYSNLYLHAEQSLVSRAATEDFMLRLLIAFRPPASEVSLFLDYYKVLNTRGLLEAILRISQHCVFSDTYINTIPSLASVIPKRHECTPINITEMGASLVYDVLILLLYNVIFPSPVHPVLFRRCIMSLVDYCSDHIFLYSHLAAVFATREQGILNILTELPAMAIATFPPIEVLLQRPEYFKNDDTIHLSRAKFHGAVESTLVQYIRSDLIAILRVCAAERDSKTLYKNYRWQTFRYIRGLTEFSNYLSMDRFSTLELTIYCYVNIPFIGHNSRLSSMVNFVRLAPYCLLSNNLSFRSYVLRILAGEGVSLTGDASFYKSRNSTQIQNSLDILIYPHSLACRGIYYTRIDFSFRKSVSLFLNDHAAASVLVETALMHILVILEYYISEHAIFAEDMALATTTFVNIENQTPGNSSSTKKTTRVGPLIRARPYRHRLDDLLLPLTRDLHGSTSPDADVYSGVLGRYPSFVDFLRKKLHDCSFTNLTLSTFQMLPTTSFELANFSMSAEHPVQYSDMYMSGRHILSPIAFGELSLLIKGRLGVYGEQLLNRFWASVPRILDPGSCIKSDNTHNHIYKMYTSLPNFVPQMQGAAFPQYKHYYTEEELSTIPFTQLKVSIKRAAYHYAVFFSRQPVFFHQFSERVRMDRDSIALNVLILLEHAWKLLGINLTEFPAASSSGKIWEMHVDELLKIVNCSKTLCTIRYNAEDISHVASLHYILLSLLLQSVSLPWPARESERTMVNGKSLMIYILSAATAQHNYDILNVFLLMMLGKCEHSDHVVSDNMRQLMLVILQDLFLKLDATSIPDSSGHSHICPYGGCFVIGLQICLFLEHVVRHWAGSQFPMFHICRFLLTLMDLVGRLKHHIIIRTSLALGLLSFSREILSALSHSTLSHELIPMTAFALVSIMKTLRQAANVCAPIYGSYDFSNSVPLHPLLKDRITTILYEDVRSFYRLLDWLKQPPTFYNRVLFSVFSEAILPRIFSSCADGVINVQGELTKMASLTESTFLEMGLRFLNNQEFFSAIKATPYKQAREHLICALNITCDAVYNARANLLDLKSQDFYAFIYKALRSVGGSTPQCFSNLCAFVRGMHYDAVLSHGAKLEITDRVDVIRLCSLLQRSAIDFTLQLISGLSQCISGIDTIAAKSTTLGNLDTFLVSLHDYLIESCLRGIVAFADETRYVRYFASFGYHPISREQAGKYFSVVPASFGVSLSDRQIFYVPVVGVSWTTVELKHLYYELKSSAECIASGLASVKVSNINAMIQNILDPVIAYYANCHYPSPLFFGLGELLIRYFDYMSLPLLSVLLSPERLQLLFLTGEPLYTELTTNKLFPYAYLIQYALLTKFTCSNWIKQACTSNILMINSTIKSCIYSFDRMLHALLTKGSLCQDATGETIDISSLLTQDLLITCRKALSTLLWIDSYELDDLNQPRLHMKAHLYIYNYPLFSYRKYTPIGILSLLMTNLHDSALSTTHIGVETYSLAQIEEHLIPTFLDSHLNLIFASTTSRSWLLPVLCVSYGRYLEYIKHLFTAVCGFIDSNRSIIDIEWKRVASIFMILLKLVCVALYAGERVVANQQDVGFLTTTSTRFNAEAERVSIEGTCYHIVQCLPEKLARFRAVAADLASSSERAGTRSLHGFHVINPDFYAPQCKLHTAMPFFTSQNQASTSDRLELRRLALDCMYLNSSHIMFPRLSSSHLSYLSFEVTNIKDEACANDFLFIHLSSYIVSFGRAHNSIGICNLLEKYLFPLLYAGLEKGWLSFNSYAGIMRHYQHTLKDFSYDIVGLHIDQMVKFLGPLSLTMESFKPLLYMTILMVTHPQNLLLDSLFRLLLFELSTEEIAHLDDLCSKIISHCHWYNYVSIPGSSSTQDISITAAQYFLASSLTGLLDTRYSEEVRIGFWRVVVPFLRLFPVVKAYKCCHDSAHYSSAIALVNSYVIMIIAQMPVLRRSRFLFCGRIINYMTSMCNALATTGEESLFDNEDTILLTQTTSELVVSIATFIVGLDLNVVNESVNYRDTPKACVTLESDSETGKMVIALANERKQKHLLAIYKRLLPELAEDSVLQAVLSSLMNLISTCYVYVLCTSSFMFSQALDSVSKSLEPYLSSLIFVLLKIVEISQVSRPAEETVYQESNNMMSEVTEELEWAQLYIELNNSLNHHSTSANKESVLKHGPRHRGHARKRTVRHPVEALTISHKFVGDILLGLYKLLTPRDTLTTMTSHTVIKPVAQFVVYILIGSVDARMENIQSRTLRSSEEQIRPPAQPKLPNNSKGILPVYIRTVDLSELALELAVHSRHIAEYKRLLLSILTHTNLSASDFLLRRTSFLQRLCFILPFDRTLKFEHCTSRLTLSYCRDIVEECYYYLAKISSCLFMLYKFINTVSSEIRSIYATDWSLEVPSANYDLRPGAPAFYSLDLAASYSSKNIDRTDTLSILRVTLARYIHAYRYYSSLLKPIILHLHSSYDSTQVSSLSLVLRFSFILLNEIASAPVVKFSVAFVSTNLYNIFFLGHTSVIHALEDLLSLSLVAFTIDRDRKDIADGTISKIPVSVLTYIKTCLGQLLERYKPATKSDSDSTISSSVFMFLYTSLFSESRDFDTRRLDKISWNTLSLPQEYLNTYSRYTAMILSSSDHDKPVLEGRVFIFLTHFNLVNQLLRSLEPFSFTIVISTLLFLRMLIYFNSFINFIITNFSFLKNLLFGEFKDRINELVQFLTHLLNKNVGHYIGLLEPTPTVLFSSIDNEIMILQRECNKLWHLLSPPGYFSESNFFIANLTYHASDLSRYFVDALCKRIIWNIMCETVSWYDDEANAAQRDPLHTPRERLATLVKFLKQREQLLTQNESECYSYILRDLRSIYVSLDSGCTDNIPSSKETTQKYILPAAFLYDITSPSPGEIPEDGVIKILFSQVLPQQPLNLLRQRSDAFLLLSLFMRLAARPAGDLVEFYRLVTMYTSSFAILSSFATETYHEFMTDILNNGSPERHTWSLNLSNEKRDLGKYNCNYHPSILTSSQSRIGVQRLHQKLLSYLPTLRNLDSFLFTRNSFYRLILGLIVEFGHLPCEPDTITSITESFCRHIPQQSNTSMGGLIRNFSKTISFTSFIPTHAEPTVGGIGAGLPHIGNTAGNKYGFGLIWMFYEFLLKQWRAGPPIEYENYQPRLPGAIISRRFYTDLRHNVRIVLELYNIVSDVLSSSAGSGSISPHNLFQTPIDTAEYFVFSSQSTDNFYDNLTITRDLEKITHIYLELLAISMQLYDRILFLPRLYDKVIAYKTTIFSELPKYNDLIIKFEANTVASLERVFSGRKDSYSVIKKKWEEYMMSVDKIYMVREKLQSKETTNNVPTSDDVSGIKSAEKSVMDAYRDYIDTLKRDRKEQLDILLSYSYLLPRYFHVFNMALTDDSALIQGICAPELFEDFKDQLALHNGPSFTLPRVSEYSVGDIELLRKNLYTAVTALFKILHIGVDCRSSQKCCLFDLENLNKALTWELSLKRIAHASTKLLSDKELHLGWLLPFKLGSPPASNLLGRQYMQLGTGNWRLSHANIFHTITTTHPRVSAFPPVAHSVYRPNFLYLQNSIGIQNLYYRILQRLSPIDLFSVHFLKFTKQFRESATISISYLNNFVNENPEETSEYMAIYLTELRSFYYSSFRTYFRDLPEDKHNQLFSFWMTETYFNVSHSQPRIANRETPYNSSPILPYASRINPRYNMAGAKFAFNGHLVAERNMEFLNIPRQIVNYFLDTHGTYVLSYFMSALRQVFSLNSSAHSSASYLDKAILDFHQNMKAIRQKFERAAEVVMASRRFKRENSQYQDADKLADFFNYLNEVLKSSEFNNMRQSNNLEPYTHEQVMASTPVPHINSLCVLTNLFPGPSEELFGLHLPITVLSSSILSYTQETFSSFSNSDAANDAMLYSSPYLDDDKLIQPSMLSILNDSIFLFAYLYPEEAIEFVLKSAILKRSFCTHRNLNNYQLKALPYSININAADFAHLAPIVSFQIATYMPTGYMPGLQGMALAYHLDDLVSGSGKYEQYCKCMLDLRASILHHALLADNQINLASAVIDPQLRGVLSCNLETSPDQTALKSAVSCDAMLTNLTVESQIYLLYFALTNPLDNAALIRRLLLSIRDMLISERVFLDASMTSLLYQYADLSDIYSTLLYSITAIKRAYKQAIDKEMLPQGQSLQQAIQSRKRTTDRFYRNYIHLPIVSLLSGFRTRHKDIYMAETRDISTWATCRLMVIISYTKVFSAPYQYLDDIYDDTTDTQIRAIARSYSACLWDSLRSNFTITRPHTLNSIIEHALLLGIPAAARVANKKEVNWNEMQKLSNNLPYIAETVRCIRSQIFSLMKSGKFFNHKISVVDDLKAGSQNNSFLAENIKVDDNYAALNECLMYLENPTFINDYIKNQKHLLEEIRTSLSHMRILVERSEMSFPSTVSESVSISLKNLGAGSNSPGAKDFPRYWQASAELFLHHIDSFIKQSYAHSHSSSAHAGVAPGADTVCLASHQNALTPVSLAHLWDLLVSFFVSCMNSTSNINEAADIETLNQLYESLHIEHILPIKGIQEDDSAIKRRSTMLRHYRNVLETRFCESRDRTALRTFNSMLNFVLMPPLVFYMELSPTIANLYDGLHGFSVFSKPQYGQWSMLDSILLYILGTSVMHIHPHHIAYNYRRILCVISFYPRISRHNSVARLGFLTGLLLNMYTDCDRQYPTLLKDGNYTAFPPYHVSPRAFIELTFILGIDILKVRNYLIKSSSIQDDTHQASISLMRCLKYWDILLVLLRETGAYTKKFTYLGSVHQFDVFSALSELAKRQPLLKEIASNPMQYKTSHDGLSLWLYLLQVTDASGDSGSRTPVEDIGNINQLLSLQQIFIVKITQLISHDVQAKRKGVVYDILLALILEVELCVHDTYSSKSPENSTIDPVVSMLLGFGFLLFVFAYSVYRIATLLENESTSFIAAFDGISAGAAPWYYSVTRELHTQLLARNYEIFLDSGKNFLTSYKNLISEKFQARQQLIECIDKVISMQQSKCPSEPVFKTFEKHVYNYMCCLKDIVAQRNLESTEFWGIPSINTRRFRASQVVNASLGCYNSQAGATMSPLLTDIVGGFFYDDGLLYAENSISSATHFDIDSFSGVIPPPDPSFAMPIYNNRTDHISSGIGNSLTDSVLSHLIHTSSYCKTSAGPVILFISGLPIVKLSMSNVSYRCGGTVDYLILEIPNNPYLIDCLAVFMPHAVPLRMGLYKDATNIVNGAMNPSSHVVFWEKYINISRNMHVYQCKQTTYIDKFADYSAATFQYNYRKLFGVRKAVSIGIAQRLILHELFNLPKIQLSEEVCDFSTGEIVSFASLSTPSMYGETPAFKELCLRSIIIKSLGSGQPVHDLHKYSVTSESSGGQLASNPRATIGQSLVHALTLQILMTYCPLAISRAVRHMLLDSKFRYPQAVAQNVARTISVQNATTHISHAWASEIEMQLLVNGLVEGYEGLQRDSVARTATILTSTVSSLDSRIPISKVFSDNNDYTHINDVSELIANESLTQPSLEYVAYCIDAGIEEDVRED